MPEAAFLHCPIRGQLKVTQRAKDRLTFTEEKRRIDAIKFLLQRKYPKEHFGIETTLMRFGHQGKNSFRIDFSIYDQPFEEVKGLPLEDRNGLIRVAAEIKRDHESVKQAKATQVRPALGFLPDLSSLGVYWDDVEQRFFYRTVSGSKTEIHEAPISKIPVWGASVGSTILTYADLDSTRDLVRVFDELEDALHPYVSDKSKRYAVLQQLLLVKIHDENCHKGKPTGQLDFQDFSTEAVADTVVVKRMNTTLALSLEHYQHYLPEKIQKTFSVPSEAIRRASRILAPINLLASKKEMVQAFYMKFAKNLYKWDLAQYFTPHEVIDFIVDVANPRYGEHIKDPACGSSDFLISAFRSRARTSADSQTVWGSDNSEQAVQISILNMVLNGDGKSNIIHEDSLESYNEDAKQFSVVLCNPPFGTKIKEERFEVLRKFDTAYEWKPREGNELDRTDTVRKAQQTGILFAELCVRLLKPGGRVGIILPNGYLGNRSPQYLALREWLLRNTRIAGIVSFPRFTFKKSGADVSASVVFAERRKTPLARARDSKDYRFFVGMIESVGWRAGDKKAVPIFLRDQQDGTMIMDDNNDPILDSDFARIFDDCLRSQAIHCFRWLQSEQPSPTEPQGWSVGIEDVINRTDLSLDPKRCCHKFIALQSQIREHNYLALGEVLEIVERQKVHKTASEKYQYVEIQNVGSGDYDYEELRGWQLPDRGKLRASPQDIFIAHVWGCAGKWFMAPGKCERLVVTNGCTRTRIRPGKESNLPDVVAGLCSEAFRAQMRALTTGSDGLAEISDDDLLSILIPKILGQKHRQYLQELIADSLQRDVRISKAVQQFLGTIPTWPTPPPQESLCPGLTA